MKKIKHIATALFLGLSLNSCQDFLEEDVRSNVSSEFYNTSEGFDLIVNSNYSQLREIFGNEPWLFSAGTDMYAEGRDAEPPGLSQYTQLDANSEGVAHLYSSCFRAIQLANTAIFYSETTEESPVKQNRIGEVKFLRAHAYFLLVQTYGGVSIVTDYIEEPILEFDRDSAEDVYSFIISELEESLDLVEDNMLSARVNRRAVEHYLAKVYLTRGYESFGSSSDFATAASYADDAIAGEGLTISFSEYWLPDTEYTIKPGTIFSVQYDESSTNQDPFKLGHMQSSYFGPYQGGSEIAGDAPYRTYTLCPTQYAINLFTEEDERWHATFMQEVYERYFDFYDFEDTSSLNVAHYYAAAWENSQQFENDYQTEHPEATFHSFGSYVPSINPNNDYQTIPVKKFDDPAAPFGEKTNRRDIVLARLAETYLIAAEAYLQAGNAAIGLQRLNVVRERAGVSDASPADFDINYILDERGRELLGEYHRWFDLKRTGTLVERASMYHYLIEPGNFIGANGELKILRPIPQSALDLNQNNNFPQNPAYQ
ncbi:RagB/SusD family nutrient uptake outer membrane protein [Mesonia aestuariivivens]|uniref:RagB/SusD family nutrient uptake outer membrane protein n=1 Tax=Mesonia aestuariivivens TaxID=2796128 RepID=A0ABS6W1S5_9FLAO|nr:RagB/SusD family nutrient uptake outer membrane protein [Mesonia aestuariivivens]MBW2961764.1 RagB/SusD family nutrient uptake outer membrane protein [Mesonia aestuariivivens]